MKDSIKNILSKMAFAIIVASIAIIYVLHTESDLREKGKTKSVINSVEVSSSEKDYMEKEIEIAHIILGVTIISFVISFEMINKGKMPKESSKEIEDLISPSLAEAIIDGKIEIKNLIMSTIIDLSVRKNIEIINNENIRLISKENLEPYELEIIDLIFQESTEISFKNINTVFKNSNDKTFEFGKRIEKIKISIMDNLYKNKIFSNFKTFFYKTITLIAILSIINLILLPARLDTEEIVQVNIFVTIGYITFLLKGISILNENSSKNGKLFYSLNFMIIILCITWFFSIKKFIIYKPQFLVIALLIFILNMLIIKNRKEIVLTDKGKIEKIKLLKLKNYINEYSLMKDRDLSATIVWDKYLAYAAAFEIPNKVTNSIYESWYNLNITLQFIDKAL